MQDYNDEYMIWVVNAGSSSLKMAAYKVTQAALHCIAEASVQHLGAALNPLHLWVLNGFKGAMPPLAHSTHCQAFSAVVGAFVQQGVALPKAIGHRFTQGGALCFLPQQVTPQLRQELQAAVALSPLHTPSALAVLDASMALWASLTHVVCFDTAFFQPLPEVAKQLPLPQQLLGPSLQRYGFHGLSYDYLRGQLAPLPPRTIFAHLGSGASMVALYQGVPVETTMGFSTLGGLMMGTRCGDLDPGVVLYLLLQMGLKAKDIQAALYHDSGLKGVSGVSGDMQQLLALAPTHAPSALAVELFCYRARQHLGALSAVLGGLDLLVFTGGIGQHSARVRAQVCKGLQYLGIALNAQRNTENALLISEAHAACVVKVVPTDEAIMIAHYTEQVLQEAGSVQKVEPKNRN